MSNETNGSLQARAIEWHERLGHADDATWEAVTAWLEEDPRHAASYEAIEQLDRAIEPLLPKVVFREAVVQPPQPADTGRLDSKRWGLYGIAMAASVAAIVFIAPRLASQRYEVATGAGEHRLVTLDAMTRVMLNESTRMTFDRSDLRFAALTSGQALFRVRHDSAKPFKLYVGESRVTDVGTVFDVLRDSAEVRVAVAEGNVVYNSSQNAIPLEAGQVLVVQPDSGTVRLSRAPIGSVGSWQTVHLVYSADPLARVAADLSRALGVHIAVAPAIADRLFSGAIVVTDGVGELDRLKRVLNVGLKNTPDGWLLTPLEDGAR